tara:strand:+ start:173 stop:556 length:384 start_codon:yes stop_codon:yes gene_type:complete
MFSTILFPVHQSKQPLETAKTVIELCQQRNSKLIMLSVLSKEEVQENSSKNFSSLVTNVKNLFKKNGINLNILQKEGDPVLVISDLSVELNVDVIIIGTSGINIQRDHQSTASQVIHKAPCPVIVVP